MPLFLTAMMLGFVYAAAPGPVTTESIRRAARLGFRAGFAVQAGSLIGDGVWAIIGLSGAAILLRNEMVGILLGLAGAGLLLWLARQVLLAALFPHQEMESGLRTGSPLRIGLAFGLANPAGIAFWSGLGASMFNGVPPSLGSVATLVVCFLLGATAWGAILTRVVAWGSSRAGQHLLRGVDAVSAVILGWLGVRLLVDNVQRLRLVSSPVIRAFL